MELFLAPSHFPYSPLLSLSLSLSYKEKKNIIYGIEDTIIIIISCHFK